MFSSLIRSQYLVKLLILGEPKSGKKLIKQALYCKNPPPMRLSNPFFMAGKLDYFYLDKKLRPTSQRKYMEVQTAVETHRPNAHHFPIYQAEKNDLKRDFVSRADAVVLCLAGNASSIDTSYIEEQLQLIQDASLNKPISIHIVITSMDLLDETARVEKERCIQTKIFDLMAKYPSLILELNFLDNDGEVIKNIVDKAKKSFTAAEADFYTEKPVPDVSPQKSEFETQMERQERAKQIEQVQQEFRQVPINGVQSTRQGEDIDHQDDDHIMRYHSDDFKPDEYQVLPSRHWNPDMLNITPPEVETDTSINSDFPNYKPKFFTTPVVITGTLGVFGGACLPILGVVFLMGLTSAFVPPLHIFVAVLVGACMLSAALFGGVGVCTGKAVEKCCFPQDRQASHDKKFN